MRIRSVPHCSFSDFEGRGGSIKNFRKPSLAKNDFHDIPNYRLSSKAFDAQHLDRFIIRVNENPNNIMSFRSDHQ